MTKSKAIPSPSKIEVDAELDLRGLRCPLPVLKVRKEMTRLGTSRYLRVYVTDPVAPGDLEVLCRNLGAEVCQSSEDDGVFSLLIRT